jgi:hypothetical protein
MGLLKLFTTEIADKYIRENFLRLDKYLRADVFGRCQFRFFEYTVENRGTFPLTLEVPHSLGFRPKDIITLSVADSDAATLAWNYDDFTRTNLSFTVSAACTIRAFVGRYGEN